MVVFEGKYDPQQKSYKAAIFAIALTVFEIFAFQKSWPWKCMSKSWYTTFAVASFDSKYVTSYLMAMVIFALSHCLWDIRKTKIRKWPGKFRSRSRSTTFEIVPIRWQISTSINVILEHFSLAFIHFFNIHILKNGDLENVRKYHDLQHSLWRHSMANMWLRIWWQ